MPADRLLPMVLCGLTAFSAANVSHAQDAPLPACFAPAQTDEIEPRFPILAAHADELSRLAASDERIPGIAVYLLTRQMVLLERIQRRLQLHSDYACESDFSSLQRDFHFLRTTNSAFLNGDRELEIAKLEAPRARELLAKLEEELAALAAPIAALRWLGSSADAGG